MSSRDDEIPHYAHENLDTEAGKLALELNRCHLKVALLVAPSASDDVETHLSYWSAALGMPRYLINRYAEIGMMLKRMPQLGELLWRRSFLPFDHMATIAKHSRLVRDDALDDVEQDIIAEIMPKKKQAIRGRRPLFNRVQKVISQRDPDVRPVEDINPNRQAAYECAATMSDIGIDVTASGPEESAESAEAAEPSPAIAAAIEFYRQHSKINESVTFSESPDAEEVTITAVLSKSHGVEVMTILKAISAHAGCNRTESFLHAIRGTHSVDVQLNLYRVLTIGAEKPKNTPTWLQGAGWLEPMVADSWLNRVTSIRVLGEKETADYHPTPQQRLYVTGRDGVCRHPGCDVPAERCDIDHIEPFNHENPDLGGKTTVDNLHCLCRKHHNLKTAGIISVSSDEAGTDTWTAHTGEQFVTTPEGPLAEAIAANASGKESATAHGRYTFERQALRKVETLREYNEQRSTTLDALAKVLKDARREALSEEDSVNDQVKDNDATNPQSSSVDSPPPF